MRHLSCDDLLGLASPTHLVAAIEQALRDYAGNKVTVPVRQHLGFGDSTLLTMPAIGEHSFGVKIVSITPSNSQRGMPVVHGLMTLERSAYWCSARHAGCGGMLTAQRTGAVGAVGLKYTTPAMSRALASSAVGVQGVWQAIFACSVRRHSAASTFSARSDEKAQRFEAVSPSPGVCLRLSCIAAAPWTNAGSSRVVIIAATTSSEPVCRPSREMLAGKHFISVGSFKPSMQELPNALYETRRACRHRFTGGM